MKLKPRTYQADAKNELRQGLINGLPIIKGSNKMSKNLTIKQNRFIHEYLLNGNATSAAKKAGYSKKTAREIGHENLTKPHVAEAILNELKKRNDEAHWSFKKKLFLLQDIVEASIKKRVDKRGNFTMFNVRAALSAIAEMNRMQGHYAPKQVTQTVYPPFEETLRLLS